MEEIIKNYLQQFLNKNISGDFKVGDFIKVVQKIKENDKDKEIEHKGLVIAKKHGKGLDGTFTIRNVYQDIGVEKTFPLHLPSIVKIEILKRAQRVKTAKLYWTRGRTEKEIRTRLRLIEQREKK